MILKVGSINSFKENPTGYLLLWNNCLLLREKTYGEIYRTHLNPLKEP